MACVGWLGHYTSKPVLEAHARLGCLGVNRAAYEAVILALSEAREYVVANPWSVSHVVVHSDSATVIGTLNGRYGVDELAAHRAKAREAERPLLGARVEVHYEWVPRKNPHHMEAHRLVQEARRNVAG